MELTHLTAENINRSGSLFDLLVLVWAEIRGIEGSVLDADHQAFDDDDQRMAALERSLRSSILRCWEEQPLFAGTMQIDTGVHATLSGLLEQADTPRALLHVKFVLARLAAQIEVNSTDPLNRHFRGLGELYRRPATPFRSHMTTSEPPAPIGESGNTRFADFTVLPAGVRDTEVEFVEARTCRAARHRGPLVIAIGDFCDDLDRLELRDLYERNGLHYPRITMQPGPGCGERLRQMLTEMDEAGAHIGVLPELTMTPELLDTLSRTMEEIHDRARGANSLRLVVAGSLHEPAGQRRVHNISTVIAEGGVPLWSQRKRNPFAWPEAAPVNREPLDTTERRMCICDLWVGRATVAICLDYLLPEFSELARDLAVDCFFVPAMSKGTGEFSRRAWQNVRELRAATFVSNTSCQDPRPDHLEAASLAALPRKGKEREVVRNLSLAEGRTMHCIEVD